MTRATALVVLAVALALAAAAGWAPLWLAVVVLAAAFVLR